jgi:hypothetical protein
VGIWPVPFDIVRNLFSENERQGQVLDLEVEMREGHEPIEPYVKLFRFNFFS